MGRKTGKEMDIKYMERAVQLSKKGIGYTNPNPLVGAVIVKNNKVIGEGYHKKYGGPHAEINALNNAIEDVKGGTIYVTLEPCSHFGKTPPCAKAIIEHKITKAVIGMVDPNPVVSGNGIRMLKEAGIEVVTGVLEDEVVRLNEVFIKYITTKLPFCTMKTAMTLDGKIAAFTGDSKWISGQMSREYVHKLRHRVSGIMVGVGTVIEDDPRLTTRLSHQMGIDPVRIILDSRGRTPLGAKVLNTDSKTKTIIATTVYTPKEKVKMYEDKGAEVLLLPTQEERVNLKQLVKVLGEKGIDSILLEGGAALNYSALNSGIIDKVITFIAPKIIGGDRAITPVGGEGRKCISDAVQVQDIHIQKFKNDIMIEGYIRKEE